MTREVQKPPVIVVTGGTAGVGRAVVRRFARDGASVAILARGQDGLDATAKDVEALGGRALPISCDVADAVAVEEAAVEIEEKLGPVDIWINVAFAGILSRFVDISPEDYRRVTEVTYFGQVNGTRAALRRMLPRDRGSIVLVGSALAYRGIPLQSAYCGAKHAIQGFQDAVRSELYHANSRVHLSMVHLPGVNTPQFDWMKSSLPRKPKPASSPYQPEVAADAIHYAAHHRRKQIFVGFPTVKAIWADRFASSLLDRYLGATGFEAQQDKELIATDYRDNLWEPVPGDYGAHGRFDSKSRSLSLQLLFTKHRNSIATAALLGLAWALLGNRRLPR